MTTLKNKQTIDALMDGEIVFETTTPNVLFKMEEGQLKLMNKLGKTGWHTYHAAFNWLLEKEFSLYKFIPEVGQWVAATENGKVYKGKVTSIDDGYRVSALWDNDEYASWIHLEKASFVQLADEEVRSHKIELAFNKVGRKQEYVAGDIVKYGKRLAEVVGEYKKDVYGTKYQMLLIRFVVDDRDGNEQEMQREVEDSEVTLICLREHVINLEEGM